MSILIWSILFAIGCCLIATEKGRSTIAWLILGFFFGFFALLVIICLPEKINKEDI